MHTWCWTTSILLSRSSLARTDWKLKAANVHTSLADWVLVNSLIGTALENLVLNSSLNAFPSHKVNIFLILLPNKNPLLFSDFVSLSSLLPTNKWSQEILPRRLCEKKLGMWRLQLSEMSSWMGPEDTRCFPVLSVFCCLVWESLYSESWVDVWLAIFPCIL